MTDRNSTYKHFLRLLRCGVYSCEESDTTLGTSLSHDQWREILEESEKQTVTGVVFRAVSRLPESEMPSVSILAQWLAITHRESQAVMSMSAVLTHLISTFEGNGLHPVLQKGHAVARFYPAPELRVCGDIDLWFHGNERSAADVLIKHQGINIVSTPDNGSCYMAGSTEVEHHSMLVEIHNPLHSKLVRQICNKYAPSRQTLPDGNTVSVPAPIIELLMINVHILKHCLGVGIGLRQFCDYALAWRGLTRHSGHTPYVDETEYFELCRSLGILRWTRVLHQFINLYLPAPDGDAVTPLNGKDEQKAVRRIFKLVSEGGNFGRYNPRRQSTRRMSLWQRKISTMSAFITNRSFVCRLAPAEAFWTFTRLLIGQIH